MIYYVNEEHFLGYNWKEVTFECYFFVCRILFCGFSRQKCPDSYWTILYQIRPVWYHLHFYCKLSKASAFGPWRPPLQQPLFANMWGARRLLRAYGKTEENESEFRSPDATTRNSALTRRRIFATITQNLAKKSGNLLSKREVHSFYLLLLFILNLI